MNYLLIFSGIDLKDLNNLRVLSEDPWSKNHRQTGSEPRIDSSISKDMSHSFWPGKASPFLFAKLGRKIIVVSNLKLYLPLSQKSKNMTLL